LADPDADFFIWMAKQFPDAVHDKLTMGRTMLQKICFSLCTPNLAKICRFLITEHAGLIREKGTNGWPLPIQALAIGCNRPLVQEMIVLMLKTCPECIKGSSGNWLKDLSSVAFLQQVHPLIVRELEINEEINVLTQMSNNITKAATLTSHQSRNETGSKGVKSALFHSMSVVYCSWSNLRTCSGLPEQKQQIQDKISEVCRRWEGDNDVPQIEWELEIMAVEVGIGLLDWMANDDDDGNYNDRFLREDRASENEENENYSFGSRCCWPFNRNRGRGRRQRHCRSPESRRLRHFLR
jgi:hypothetical protein